MALVVDAAAREEMCASVKELLEKGEAAEALIIAEKGLDQFSVNGDKAGEASALYMQALAQAKINEDDPAGVLFVAQKALTALKESGQKREVAGATLMVGELYAANGELDEAGKSAREASDLYLELGDQNGTASCSLLVSDLHLMREEADEAMDEAAKAYKVFSDADNAGGRANAMHKQSRAHKMNGRNMESLRAAELASKLWHITKDLKNEAQSTVAEAEAKVALLEERDEKADSNVWVMQLVTAAVAMVKKYRKKDPVCLGNALFTAASVLLHSNGLKGATQAAREACRCFRKTGNESKLARTTLIWATAEFRMGLSEDAQERTQKAVGLFDRTLDDDGKMKALDLLDDINSSLGLPTREEIAERQRQLALQQQQMMMMQQQRMMGMQMMMPAQQQQQQQVQQFEEAQEQSGGGGAVKFTREGSPLQLSAGMDPQIIKNKVSELAGAIIGDTEDLEVDTPLMEAGLTSNSAVLLRDELTKDLPGINLPPTLIFDYPSVAAIADFVVEASKKMKK